MDLLLTAQERDRFVAWLEHEAMTDKALIDQLEKLGPAMAAVANHKKVEASAALLVARKLRAIQRDSIG